MPSNSRLSRTDRRQQLLEHALQIAREEGTDALTLGHLAERAGVSKPIAYSHFETRAGLLVALYARIDELQVEALRQALENAPPRLEEIARVIANAYMECHLAVGPECIAIAAALKGDPQMEAFQRETIDSYVALYCRALAPYTDLAPETLRLRGIAINGAGEALSREMLQGRTDAATASAALADLIMRMLAPSEPPANAAR